MGGSGLLRLLSCGDLRRLRDVTGKLSSAIVEFVAPLRLWHSLRPPPMVGSEGERPADRRALEGVAAKTGSVASTSSTVQERSREKEEGARRSQASF